ncbi:MAG TPA: hypothetical protein VIY86_11155, partial [Pirellulaceae bacterium]
GAHRKYAGQQLQLQLLPELTRMDHRAEKRAAVPGVARTGTSVAYRVCAGSRPAHNSGALRPGTLPRNSRHHAPA